MQFCAIEKGIKELNIFNRVYIDVNSLYPTEMIDSIQPEQIDEYKTKIKNEDDINLTAFEYKGYYFILEGHAQFLALASLGWKKIPVFIANRADINFYSIDKNVEDTLKRIGTATLYVFEMIGNYQYDVYPDLYS